MRLKAMLKAALSGTSSGSEATYRAQLVARLQKHHLGGVDAALEEIFVAPRLLAPQSGPAEDESLDDGPSTMHTLWPDLAAGIATAPPASATLDGLLNYGRRVIISGEPGSGKSTLLAYCALLCAASETEGALTVPAGSLPIFLHLSELEARLTEQNDGNVWSPDPLVPLVTILRQGGQKTTEREVWLREAATGGRLFLMIDGWDELPGKGLGRAGGWLREFLKAFPETRVLMAGPSRGYGPLMQLGFVVSGVLRWRSGQAQELGQKWAAASAAATAEATVVGESPDLSTYWQPGQLPLMTALGLRQVLGRPAPASELVGRRQVEQLQDGLEAIIGKTIDENVWPELGSFAREFWQAIALVMVIDSAWEISAEMVDDLARSVLAGDGDSEAAKRKDRLLRTLEESGLFVLNRSGSIRFLSPVWRDYLAARRLAERKMIPALVEHANESHWAGVVRCYVAFSGATGLLSHLAVNGKNRPDVYQEATWLAEVQGEEQWRQRILIHLGKACLDAGRPTMARQRAAAALASSGDSGVAALMSQVIRQFEPSMRQVALAVMARVAPEECIDLARRLFADSDARVRVAAVHAVAWIRGPEAEKALLDALYMPDRALSRAAAVGLALRGTDEAYRSLREASVHKEFGVRQAAALGLRMVHEPWAASYLARLAESEAPRAAMGRPASATGPGFVVPAKQWSWPRPGDQPWLVAWAIAQNRLVPVGQAATPFILEALQDDQASIRERAAATLGRLALVDGIGPLRKALRDESPVVRQAAYIALSRITRAWDVDSSV